MAVLERVGCVSRSSLALPAHVPFCSAPEGSAAHRQVYSNVTGKPYTSVDEIKSLLKRQMLEPVKWEQGTLDLITLGCTQYVEPGPGKQLKAMMMSHHQIVG